MSVLITPLNLASDFVSCDFGGSDLGVLGPQAIARILKIIKTVPMCFI
jgi:hypothetical protein